MTICGSQTPGLLSNGGLGDRSHHSGFLITIVSIVCPRIETVFVSLFVHTSVARRSGG